MTRAVSGCSALSDGNPEALRITVAASDVRWLILHSILFGRQVIRHLHRLDPDGPQHIVARPRQHGPNRRRWHRQEGTIVTRMNPFARRRATI